MTYSRGTLAVVAALALSKPALGQNIDCSQNQTISNADDARALRDECDTVEGSVEIAWDVSETINLDGIETIRGDLTHGDCSANSDSETYCGDLSDSFNITSDSLKEIEGSLIFRDTWTLEAILFPELETVQGSVIIETPNITVIDFENLERIRNLKLHSEKLETFRIDSLEGFTDSSFSDPFINITHAGNVTSLDGLFASYIDFNETGGLPEDSNFNTLMIERDAIQEIKSLTIGWTNVKELWIGGHGLTLTFGGPETNNQYIDDLNVQFGVDKLQRGDGVDNITIDEFDMFFQTSMAHLTLPFDQVGTITLDQLEGLETVEFPDEAKNWDCRSITIQGCRDLDLGRSTWVWPEKLQELVIYHELTEDFV
jgi:hypothetical protein